MNKDSKIYIAGHKGLVGSALWNNLLSKGYTNLIGRMIDELDLMNQQAVAEFFQKEKPPRRGGLFCETGVRRRGRRDGRSGNRPARGNRSRRARRSAIYGAGLHPIPRRRSAGHVAQ